MSLLTAVEETIESYKAEQARINENTLRYKEILQSIAPPPEKDDQVLECPEDPPADTDLSPKEKEEIDLLERALAKALRIRAATEPSQRKPKQPGPLKGAGADVKPKKVPQTSEVRKGSQTAGRTNSLSSRPRTSTSSKPGSRAAIKHRDKINPTKSRCESSAEATAVSTCGPRESEFKPAVRSLIRDEDTDKPAATSRSDQAGKQNRRSSEQAGTWKYLIMKQNRLWDKVMDAQRKPVPGRSRFTERMRATFPKDLAYGAPDQNRVLVDQLFHQQLDPLPSFQTRELLPQQAADGCTKPEGQAWDGGWAEGAGLCPTNPEGDGMLSALPLTVTYTTEAELRHLERLRMKVELLQEEVYLERALWDALSPRLSAVTCEPVCSNPSELRDIYSLLAEGGQTFPSIVLDPDQTD